MSLRWRLFTVKPRRVAASALFLGWGAAMTAVGAAHAIGGLFRDLLEDLAQEWRLR